MSDFAWPVGTGSSAQVEPRVLTAQYSGGYKQALADGPNNTLRKWALTFNGRSWTMLSEINAFLKARGGWQIFSWTPPDPIGADEGEINVRCPRWAFKWDAGGHAVGLDMDFEEVTV